MKIPHSTSFTLTWNAHSGKPKAWKTHMYAEWFSVLFVMALCLVGVALWSSYIYGDVVNRLSAENAAKEQESVLSIDKDSLTATLLHFEGKNKQYNALINAKPVYDDPSR